MSATSRPRRPARGPASGPAGGIGPAHPLSPLRTPHAHRIMGRVALVAAITGVLVLALGGGQAYWLAVPAVLVTTAACRTRVGVVAAAGAVVLAAEIPTAIVHGAAQLPSTPLALLVPAASAAILLAVRERLEAEREAMRRSALTDPLTGVANRRSLLSRIEYEVARHARTRHPFGLVMLDLDGFKQLNDRYGHPAGDEILREVAAAIARAVRDQDTVARLGGDEFCVLAPETDLTGTQHLAARVLAAVGSVTAGIDVLGASAGVCTFPVDGALGDELLEAADQRLLESKRRRGRHRVRRAA